MMSGVLQQPSVLIAFVSGMYLITAWLMKFQKNLNISLKTAVILAISHVAIGVLAMKLLAIIEVGGKLEQAANFRLFGAIFVLPVFYYVWAKVNKKKVSLVLDLSIVCILIGVVTGRINCMVSGCCEGIPIHSGTDMRWPLREIELIYSVVLSIGFGRKVLRKQTYGQGVPVLLISYGILRFCMEWVREEYTGSLGIFHLAHIWSLIAIAVGAVMYYKVRKNIRPGEARRNDAKSKHLAKGGK